MSHGRDKERSRENRAKVREILMREWDPIGISDIPEASHQYDRYAGRVYVMLMDEGAASEAITEAIPVLEGLTKTGSREDRTWAYIAWGLISEDQQGFAVERRLLNEALALDSDNILALSTRARGEELLRQLEPALADNDRQNALLSSHRQTMVRQEYVPTLLAYGSARSAALKGDFQEAVRQFLSFVDFDTPGRLTTTGYLVTFHLGLHDPTAARAALANPLSDTPLLPGGHAISLVLARIQVASALADWTGVLNIAKELAPVIQKYPGQAFSWSTTVTPLLAQAEAQLGNIAHAQALIDSTPGECYDCLLSRARLALQMNKTEQADYWFAKAVTDAPSIPFANEAWGRALLVRGKPDDAIAQFTASNKKGPHFADAMEGWGEALMAKNQSHLALAKFAEAEKYAPNWGRLHLKWGEALVWAGETDDAKAQFARAAQLDLTPSEKAELGQHS